MKILLDYVKSILKSNKTDKIKAFVDSRIIYFMIPFLEYNDKGIRQDLLEIYL